MKLPTIPPGLAGKIVKNRPLSEPIRLQDLEVPPARKLRKKINDDILLPQVAQNFLKSGSKVAFYVKFKVLQVKY